MKKFLILSALFGAVSYMVFLGYYSWSAEGSSEGDPPLKIETVPTVLGGTVKKPHNDTITIGEMQTSYIMYVKGDIEFDQMVEENMDNLRRVLNFPFNPEKGYLFSSGYDDNSVTQIYYQSNQEETRTVILKVVHGKKENSVEKIYDGNYFKLVAVNEDNPKELIAYDEEHDAHKIEVEK